MGLHAVKILGITITVSSKKDILEYMEMSLGKPLIITTPNPEQIVYSGSDSAFADILNKSDIAIPDGIGVAWALGVPNIAGVDFMEDLVGLAARKRIPIALIGGREGVAVKAFECLSRRWAGLRGWAIEPEQLEMGEIAKKIQSTGVGMVFVGLGAPKQEYFIARLSRAMSFRPPSRNPEKKTWIPGQARDDKKGIIFMSVGGSFDIISGRIRRAPIFLRTLGLEWLWRLVREPWRLGRQLALIKFIWFVVLERFSTK